MDLFTNILTENNRRVLEFFYLTKKNYLKFLRPKILKYTVYCNKFLYLKLYMSYSPFHNDHKINQWGGT